MGSSRRSGRPQKTIRPRTHGALQADGFKYRVMNVSYFNGPNDSVDLLGCCCEPEDQWPNVYAGADERMPTIIDSLLL